MKKPLLIIPALVMLLSRIVSCRQQHDRDGVGHTAENPLILHMGLISSEEHPVTKAARIFAEHLGVR